VNEFLLGFAAAGAIKRPVVLPLLPIFVILVTFTWVVLVSLTELAVPMNPKKLLKLITKIITNIKTVFSMSNIPTIFKYP